MRAWHRAALQGLDCYLSLATMCLGHAYASGRRQSAVCQSWWGLCLPGAARRVRRALEHTLAEDALVRGEERVCHVEDAFHSSLPFPS